MNCGIYDVVIIGGGPAGLIAAHELSKYKHINVMLVEKDRVETVKRTWNCWITQAKEYGFDDCIDNVSSYISMRTKKGTEFKSKEKVVALNEKRFLKKYLRYLKNTNVSIKENSELSNVYFDDINNVNVLITSKGLFHSKLIIDCSGDASILTKLYNPILDDGLYCYAKIFSNAKYKDKKFYLWDVPFDDPAYSFWYFPYSKNKIMVGLILNLKQKPIVKKEVVDKFNAYVNLKGVSGTSSESLVGAIPFFNGGNFYGNNYIQVGSSAKQIIPITGWGFIPSIKYSKLCIKYVLKFLETNNANYLKKYQKAVLNNSFKLNSAYNDLFGFILNNGSVNDFDSVLKIFTIMPSEFYYKGINGRLTRFDMVYLLFLAAINYPFLRFFMNLSFSKKLSYLKATGKFIYRYLTFW